MRVKRKRNNEVKVIETDGDISVEPEENEETTEMIPGLDIIGKGYDVFGRFAHPSGVINQKIFKDFTESSSEVVVGGVTYQVPEEITCFEEHTSEGSYIEGSSISDFQSQLDSSVKMEGSYKYYSGEADFGFHQSKQVSNEYYYTSFSVLTHAYRLTLPDNSELIGNLNEDFANKLNSEDNSNEAIDAFFNEFGTHFMAEVVLGGRTAYYATVNKSAVSSELNVEASVKASYNSLFASAQVEVDTSYEEETATSSTHSETGIETIGGDENIAPLMLTDEDAYENWLDSISGDPALVDFTDQSLRPIWDLCNDTLRSEALENRFDELSSESNATFTRGEAAHGESIYPPWGVKDDWNVFISPAILGLEEVEDGDDSDNGLLDFDYGIDNDVVPADHWQVKARFRFRTAKDKNEIDWNEEHGLVNYILVPKVTYEYINIPNYTRYDANSGNLLSDASDADSGDADSGDVDNVVGTYDDDINVLEIIDGDTYSNVIYDDDNNLFYQEKKVSYIQKFPNGNGFLNPPDSESDWNFLITPIRLSYSDGKDEDDKNNTLIRWDWNDKYEAPPSFLGLCDYRKGPKKEGVLKLFMGYMVLWVNSDYSSVTTGSGKAEIQLPTDDAKMDDWEFIASPIRMGNNNETENEDLKDSSLLMTKCKITSGDTGWNVDGSYLWCDHEKDADSVDSRDGQVDCLFVRTSVLTDISVNT